MVGAAAAVVALPVVSAVVFLRGHPQESLHIAAGEFYNTTSQFLSMFRMGFSNLKCKKTIIGITFSPSILPLKKNRVGMFFKFFDTLSITLVLSGPWLMLLIVPVRVQDSWCMASDWFPWTLQSLPV
jgi:hypothetical protein